MLLQKTFHFYLEDLPPLSQLHPGTLRKKILLKLEMILNLVVEASEEMQLLMLLLGLVLLWSVCRFHVVSLVLKLQLSATLPVLVNDCLRYLSWQVILDLMQEIAWDLELS